MPVGPIEVGRHHHYQESAREESDMGATLGQVFFVLSLLFSKVVNQFSGDAKIGGSALRVH